ncbi:hypothetical protein D3C76_1484890 [compost metagenome]
MKVSIVNWEKTACRDPLGIHSRNAETSSRFKFLIASTFTSWVNGFSLTRVILFSRLFLSRLSGIYRIPKITFTRVMIAPKYMGTEYPNLASSPPRAGPMAAPAPATALTHPKILVRSSLGVISAK